MGKKINIVTIFNTTVRLAELNTSSTKMGGREGLVLCTVTGFIHYFGFLNTACLLLLFHHRAPKSSIRLKDRSPFHPHRAASPEIIQFLGESKYHVERIVTTGRSCEDVRLVLLAAFFFVSAFGFLGAAFFFGGGASVGGAPLGSGSSPPALATSKENISLYKKID